MKKALLILSFLLFVQLTVSAQSSVWKVEGKGTTLYLGGTIHLLRSTDYPLPAAFDSIYKISSTLVFEADLAQMEDPALMQVVMQKSQYNDDRTLKSVLDSATYAALETECKAIGLPLAMMQKFKPSIIVLQISMLKMQQMGMAATGVDKHYYTKGLEDEKGFAYLETVEQQLDIITDLGVGNENEFVKYSLDSYDEMEEELESMIISWKEGKPKVMEEEIREMESDFPDIYALMLKDRNDNWIPKLEEFLDNEEIEFVLVGSLHLYGDDGIIQQLKDLDYKVTQNQ